MTDAWAVSIVIPARDEAATIGRCIKAVIVAATAAGHPFDITVVADACTDATASEASAAVAGRGQVVDVALGCVGASRRVGTARSLATLAPVQTTDRTWILATDADSHVPPEWITSHLRLAEAGAHGVAGLVAVDSFAEHPPGVEAAFHRRYDLRSPVQHPHVHGTNLGVRADAYLRAGGWADTATGEDHDLWERLRSTGAALSSSVDSPVRTSGRLHGRAPAGFAALLRSLATGATP